MFLYTLLSSADAAIAKMADGSKKAFWKKGDNTKLPGRYLTVAVSQRSE